MLTAGIHAAYDRGFAALFVTTAAAFRADHVLAHEVFGAASLIVDSDHADAAALLPLLERKAGRLLANGWPTGVEVSTAMVHGGPFPATSDLRGTSVGTAAIERFLRPACYQDLPTRCCHGR